MGILADIDGQDKYLQRMELTERELHEIGQARHFLYTTGK